MEQKDKAIDDANWSKLQEIRFCSSGGLWIYIDGIKLCISDSGDIVSDISNGIILDEDIAENIMSNITGMSAYAYNYQLNSGYISLKHGCRVGVCGDVSYNREGKGELTKINTVTFRVSQDRMLYNIEYFKKLSRKGDVENVVAVSRAELVVHEVECTAVKHKIWE